MSKKLTSRLLSCFLAVVFVMSLTTQAFALDKHRPSPEGPTSLTNANLNFYINLAGDILDVSGDSSQHASSLFTDKLTSEFTVNANLQEDVFNSSYYCLNSSQFDSIVGEDESDYENIDSEIRNILDSYISFPSDEDILSEIKTQIADGSKIYDINGELVYESLVSTDYYNVFWYVLKEGNDHWHVDGVLVKKSVPLVNVYDVTYSWTLDCNVPGVQFPNITPPEKVTYAENDLVTPDYTYNRGFVIADPDDIGIWQFSGWSIRNPFNITEDTEITGEWEFTQYIPTPTPTPVQYSYQIVYTDANRSSIRSPESGTIEAGTGWDLTSKVPDTIVYNGITYNKSSVDGPLTGTNANANIVVTVVYLEDEEEPTPSPKIYSVRYEWTVNGGPGLPSAVTLPEGESHDSTFCFSCDGRYKGLEVSVTGGKYVFSGWSDGRKSPATGTLIREPGEQIECTVEELVLRGTWEWVEDEVVPPSPSTPSKKTYYKIEVEFVDANGNEIADEYSTTVRKNHEYDVTNKIPDTIVVGDKEYSLKTTSGDPLSGIANTNKKITAWYVEEPKKDETPNTGDFSILSVFTGVSSSAGILFLNRKRKKD